MTAKFNSLRKTPTQENTEKDIDVFISQASTKTGAFQSEIELYKNAKRDQNILLRLNHYEMDLINRTFEKSMYRSKLELVRALLIPALEALDTKQ